MNPVSEKTRNQNILRTKTKGFKDNLRDSELRMKSTSSLHNLAGKLYTDKNASTPAKRGKNNSAISRNSSTGKLAEQKSLLNPELLMASTLSHTISGLSMRASYVPSYADMNTNLLREKKNLEQRIAALRQGIVQQKKKLNNAEYNCKKNANELETTQSMYNEAHARSQKLNQNLESTANDCSNFRRDIKALKAKTNERKEDIGSERSNVAELDRQTKMLKTNLMHEDKIKSQTKSELSKAQKVMNSATIYYKELENEKAMLLLEINQSVDSNRL